MRSLAAAGLCILGLAGTAAASPPPASPLPAHAADDWRDQVIYFLMIDRFDDADPGNNDFGAGEYDPSQNTHYNGGDLKGIERRLDYIQGLGATAIWITPPVANQWWDWSGKTTGYHGYWASDFMALDRHVGTLADYQRLSAAIHARGMRLIQDIVVNHTGDYFGYEGEMDAADPARGYVLFEEQKRGRGQGAGDGVGGEDGACRGLEMKLQNTSAEASDTTEHVAQPRDSADRCHKSGPLPPAPCPVSASVPCPTSAPTQPPFNLNDPRRDADRRAGIYHWTPAIRDYQDPVQIADWQMGGLDDLNTGNPTVRRALRQSYDYWIRTVGVDGFRVDTAFYVPPEDFDDFLFSRDRQYPGVMRAAAANGRPDFLVFGEGFGIDRAFEDTQARRIDTYMRAPDGSPRMPGMLNFPLYGSTLDVFARGRPTAELGYRIRSMLRVHQRPQLMPSFVDNHDVDRFLAGGSEAGLQQSLLLMMTLPGIPTLYYGTEQGIREPRAAMFARGYAAGGKDHFDTSAPLYRSIQSMTALRRGHPALSRGVPTILAENAAAAGVLAYRMDIDDQALLVAFNSADAPTLLDNVELGLAPGARLRGVYAIDGQPGDLTIPASGRLTLELPPRAGLVWELPVDASARVSLDALSDAPVHDDFAVSGRARGLDAVRIVVDGDIAHAPPITVAADGRWQGRVDTAAMIDPAVTHRVVAWSSAPPAVSAAQSFRVQREFTRVVDHVDPSGDDHGRSGQVLYPLDPNWNEQRPGDIEAVRVYRAGSALKIELAMHAVLATWNPPNGFDHVAFTVFIQLPDRCGAQDGQRADALEPASVSSDASAASPSTGPDGAADCRADATVMPFQSGDVPAGMRWHYRIRANGWTNALFSAQGASASNEGTLVTPTASISSDRGARTVTLTIAGASLGKPQSLSGARLYINTWDYDGGYRALNSQPGPYQFGGGEPGDPLLIDETAVIEVP